jgi:hypothetical protein
VDRDESTYLLTGAPSVYDPITERVELQHKEVESTMNDYILLMRSDAPEDAPPPSGEQWATYFGRLHALGVFEGGSAIGEGVCVVKSGEAPQITRHLSGYIRVRAESLRQATDFVAGNPVFEAGGTAEVREIPRD